MNRFTKSRRRQKGLSAVGWLGVAAIFGFLLITFFKVFPMYYGNFKVKTVLENMQQDTSLDVKSKRAIWNAMAKRLSIQEVRGIKREHVTMERKDGKTTITVQYETSSNYILNLFIGARFRESVVINR